MRRLRMYVVLFWLGLLAMPAAAQQGGPAEQEALQVQARRSKAVMAQDVSALEPMVADELTYCHASAQCEDKASYLNTVKTGRIRWVTMNPEGMEAHVYGDTAIITGVLRQTIMAGGATKPLPLVIRSIEVYVRRNGRWQLANFQATRVAEQTPTSQK